MESERLAFMALQFVPGVGDLLIKQLISHCGSAELVFKQSKARLLKVPGIGETTAHSIRTGKTLREAEKEFMRAEREQTEILFYTDKAYPNRLKSIDDSPAILYVKGNINLNQTKTVGIVGTRRATDYGKRQV